jgi:hypothetical protein
MTACRFPRLAESNSSDDRWAMLPPEAPCLNREQALELYAVLGEALQELGRLRGRRDGQPDS